VHDKALNRVFAYLNHTSDMEIYGELGPDDFDDVRIHLYTDADWNGDASTTKSTSGLFIELHAPRSGHS